MSPEERAAIKARCEAGDFSPAVVRADALMLLAEVERLEAERDRVIEQCRLDHEAWTKSATAEWVHTHDALIAERDAALADAARLRAALPVYGEHCMRAGYGLGRGWATGRLQADDFAKRTATIVADALATPTGDEALREFGLRVATQARKVHATFGGSQVDAAAIVDAVLRGER